MVRRTTPGRPAGKYTQALRLFQLHHRLEGGPEGLRIDDLARELEVTPRSIRRDLKALQDAGIELETLQAGEERRVRLARTARGTEPIRMTRFQRYSLAAVRRVFDVLSGTPIHDDLSQLFARLAAGATDGAESAAMTERFVYIPEAPKSYRKFKDQIYELYDGLLRTLTLSFGYEAVGGSVSSRKVEPHALVLYRNGLYVIGWDQARHDWRTFAVERMRRVRALRSNPFERRADFDPHRFFDGAFGIISALEQPTERVVVDFTRDVATWVTEREWHASQKITRLDDGGVRCEFDTRVTAEVVAWLLRWGASARVLAPASLAQRLRDEFARAVAAYDTPAPPLP